MSARALGSALLLLASHATAAVQIELRVTTTPATTAVATNTVRDAVPGADVSGGYALHAHEELGPPPVPSTADALSTLAVLRSPDAIVVFGGDTGDVALLTAQSAPPRAATAIDLTVQLRAPLVDVAVDVDLAFATSPVLAATQLHGSITGFAGNHTWDPRTGPLQGHARSRVAVDSQGVSARVQLTASTIGIPDIPVAIYESTWRLTITPSLPCSTATYGAPCGASLVAEARFDGARLRVDDGTAPNSAILLLGTRTSQPLFGCELLVLPGLTLPAPMLGESASWPLPTRAVGTIHAQAATWSRSGTVHLSAGLALTCR